MIQLLIQEIRDPYIRENFQKLQRELGHAIQLIHFRPIELEFEKAVEHFKYSHGLGFTPKDVIQTLLIGPGSLSWNYDLFDSEFLDITTTGACKVRALIGTFARK